MKTRWVPVWLLLAGTMFWITGTALAQPEEGEEDEMDPAAMLQAYKKMSEPTKFHENLRPLIGRWTTASKWRMSPEESWDESTGTAEFKWILDNRFVQQQVNGSMGEGYPFEGIGLITYDKIKNKYVTVWADNFMSNFMVSEGTCDPSGKVITFHGESTDPWTGETTTDKSVMRILNNDKHVFEMYMTSPDGDEFKSLEVTYTRK